MNGLLSKLAGIQDRLLVKLNLAEEPPAAPDFDFNFVYHPFTREVLSGRVNWLKHEFYAMLVDHEFYQPSPEHREICDIPALARGEMNRLTGKHVDCWEDKQYLKADDVGFKDVPWKQWRLVIFASLPHLPLPLLAGYMVLPCSSLYFPGLCDLKLNWNRGGVFTFSRTFNLTG